MTIQVTPVAKVDGVYFAKANGEKVPLVNPTESDLFGMGQHGIFFYKLTGLIGTKNDQLVIDCYVDGICTDQFTLRHGTDLPVDATEWMDWFDIPKGTRYRCLGQHTIMFKIGRRAISKILTMRRESCFLEENGGYISPVYVYNITADKAVAVTAASGTPAAPVAG